MTENHNENGKGFDFLILNFSFSIYLFMVGGIYILICIVIVLIPFTLFQIFNICTFSIEISFSLQLGILKPNVLTNVCDQI